MKKRLSTRRNKLFSSAIAVGLIATLLAPAAMLVPAVAAQGSTSPEVKILVKGGPRFGAEGIMFDAQDRLHIASIFGREIIVMDPDSGEILDRIGVDRGVEGPDDVAFGPDGSLYWTAIMKGEVGRLSPDGVKTGQMVVPGVNPITFFDDGRLFVGLSFLGDALYELDPEFVQEPRLIADGLGGINCFDQGPDGALYAPNNERGGVVRIDVDAEPVTIEKVIEGSGCVKFDSQGRMLALIFDEQLIRVDLETGATEVLAELPRGLDNLALDSRDRVFVAHHDGTISEVLADGTLRTVSPGGLAAPLGVAVLPRSDGESVFVVDGGFTLREFDALTGEQMSIARSEFGPQPKKLMAPITLSPDGNHLLLSSWFGSNVQVWDPETQQVLEEYFFAVPYNAVRFQGDLIIAELGTTSVVRVSGSDPSQRETLAENLGVPVGLAATDDDLWVGEWATGNVLQIIADGEVLAEPVPVATGLVLPEGLAVAPDGSLLVVEGGTGRLLSVDLETGQVSTVAEGLEVGLPIGEGFPPGSLPSSVAVGPSGAIFVAGSAANVLYRIEKTALLPITGGNPRVQALLLILVWVGVAFVGLGFGLRRLTRAHG